ncbi:PREDICTED: glycine-rich RNA-binding protein 10-like [Brassica oleracea var. oleracea]|nr:PREDICTED: glycine-rich RNA-binding protein 10-like [Brassica oleracea var. oleracea]
MDLPDKDLDPDTLKLSGYPIRLRHSYQGDGGYRSRGGGGYGENGGHGECSGGRREGGYRCRSGCGGGGGGGGYAMTTKVVVKMVVIEGGGGKCKGGYCSGGGGGYLNGRDGGVLIHGGSRKKLHQPLSKKPEKMDQDEWELPDRQVLGIIRLTLSKNVAHNVAKEKTTE